MPGTLEDFAGGCGEGVEITISWLGGKTWGAWTCLEILP
jgi:hypothetical protein